MDGSIEVFSDYSERLQYNVADLPLYIKKDKLRHLPNFAAPCHWHVDLEFILVLSGDMDYFVNGHVMKIKAGEGLFINSKRLHYGFSHHKQDCEYIVITIHPDFFGPFMRPELEKKLAAINDDYLLLPNNHVTSQAILHTIKEVYQAYQIQTSYLSLSALITSACANTFDLIGEQQDKANYDHSWLTTQQMTEFIHQHYKEKMTIANIAYSGNVCRSKCCQLFKEHLGTSPNHYLMKVRIHKGCQMLKETKRSITEVALACGFQSGSYFTYRFQKMIGCLPKDYRQQETNEMSF